MSTIEQGSTEVTSAVFRSLVIAPIGNNLLESEPGQTLNPQLSALAHNTTSNCLVTGLNNSISGSVEWKGVVTGPDDAVASNIPIFGSSGQILVDSGVPITTLGVPVSFAPFGSAPNASAAVVSSNVITLEPASATFPGGVSTGAQTFAGAKTFNNGIVSPTIISTTGGDSSKNVTALVTSSVNSSTANTIATFEDTSGKVITPSSVVVTGSAISGIGSLNGNPVATGTNTGDIVMAPVGVSPNANGAVITPIGGGGQSLALQAAGTAFPGVVTTNNQSFGGIKTIPSGIIINTNVTNSVPVLTNVFSNYYSGNYSQSDADHTVNITGCFTGSATTNVVITRFPGGTNTIAISELFGTVTAQPSGVINLVFPASSNPSFPGAMPVEFAVGAGGRNATVPVIANGVATMGAMYIDPNGYVSIGSGYDPNNLNTTNLLPFQTGQVNGIFDCCVTYF